jgi:hypothetical protein
MTWARAQKIASQYAARLALPAQMGGVIVRLADYEDEVAHRFLKPGEQWSLEFHRMVTRALQRDLQRRGAHVEIVVLKMADYFDYIAKNGLENNTQNRAQFIAWSTNSR